MRGSCGGEEVGGGGGPAREGVFGENGEGGALGGGAADEGAGGGEIVRRGERGGMLESGETVSGWHLWGEREEEDVGGRGAIGGNWL